jgi:hypothetical protein
MTGTGRTVVRVSRRQKKSCRCKPKRSVDETSGQEVEVSASRASLCDRVSNHPAPGRRGAEAPVRNNGRVAAERRTSRVGDRSLHTARAMLTVSSVCCCRYIQTRSWAVRLLVHPRPCFSCCMHLISPPDKKLLSSTSRGSCICSVARGRRRFVRGVCRPRFICFRAGLFLDRRRRTGARVPFIHPSIHLPDVCCSFHARSRLRTNEARAGANKIKAAASCDAVH